MQDLPNEALAHHQAGRLDDAERIYLELLAANPDQPAILNNYSNVLKDSGRIDEATGFCKRAHLLDPGNPQIHSSLCYKLNFNPDYDRAAIFGEAREWNRRHGNRTILPHRNDRSLHRRLKIGYVSPDFYGHAEIFFVLPLLKSHDRAKFEIHSYSSVREPDKATHLAKSCAEFWHDVQTLTDDQLITQIRADQIDILVDLTMHMGFNRLGVFAQKPAPIQFTWLAYPGGTGLSAIDYRLTDSHLDPPGDTDRYYSEKSVRLPNTWLCYDHLGYTPPAAPRPHGAVAFGSLNNPCKLNRPTLALWAKLLSKIPDSIILLLCESNQQRENIRSVLGHDRVEFIGRQRRGEYLRTYDRIDICLDPLVYNGITTTCDALWMGVPVITLPGQTAPSRAGLSTLTNLQLPDLIAATEDDFLAKAINLATDHSRRSNLRAALRQRITQSPLMNAPRFAQNVESAYRDSFGIWQSAFGNPI